MELEFGANSRFGRFPLQKAKRLVNHALEIGINRFDTGFSYGNYKTQPLLAKCLESRMKKYRDEISLSTKCIGSSEYIDYCVKKSIDTFNCGYLDNLHLWGPSLKLLEDKQTIEHLKSLKREGLVNNISVNTHVLSVIDKITTGFYDEIGGILLNYNYLRQSRVKYIRRGKKNNLKIFAGTTLCQGFLLSSILQTFLRTRSPFYLARSFLSKDSTRYIKKARKYRRFVNLHYKDLKDKLPLSFIANEKDIDFVPIGMMSMDSLNKNISILKNPVDRKVTEAISKWTLDNCQLEEFEEVNY